MTSKKSTSKPKRKRQFKGTSKPKTRYDLKIWHIGYSRVLAISKFIPKEWTYVRVEKLSSSPDHVVLLIGKLLEERETAYTQPPKETT